MPLNSAYKSNAKATDLIVYPDEDIDR